MNKSKLRWLILLMWWCFKGLHWWLRNQVISTSLETIVLLIAWAIILSCLCGFVGGVEFAQGMDRLASRTAAQLTVSQAQAAEPAEPTEAATFMPLVMAANQASEPTAVVQPAEQVTSEPMMKVEAKATSSQSVEPATTVEVADSPELAPDYIDGFPVTWVGSPNFNYRPNPQDISAIVIHSTAGNTLEGVVAWFHNQQSRVSAHYSIDKDGRIVQHVPDAYRAWHAGVSEWQGKQNVNNFSIGIELVNLNDGHDSYPEVQHQALVTLVTYLCRKYQITPSQIVGHQDVARPQGRKTDPRGYDLERLRNDIGARLGQ